MTIEPVFTKPRQTFSRQPIQTPTKKKETGSYGGMLDELMENESKSNKKSWNPKNKRGKK